jgi:hypothetical protein
VGKTTIPWTDCTWNPITGCDPIRNSCARRGRRMKLCPQCGNLPHRVVGRVCSRCGLPFEPEPPIELDGFRGMGTWRHCGRDTDT